MSFPDSLPSAQPSKSISATSFGMEESLKGGKSKGMVDQEFLVDDRFMLQKIQSTIIEYNFLLTSQLEEQRAVFEQ